jgi:hypothetical protein
MFLAVCLFIFIASGSIIGGLTYTIIMQRLKPHPAPLPQSNPGILHSKVPAISRSLKRSPIVKAPGTILLEICNFLFSPKVMEQTFKPLVADWRYELFEAMKDGQKWKSRWISVSYRYKFIMAMGLSKVFSLLKIIRRN